MVADSLCGGAISLRETSTAQLHAIMPSLRSGNCAAPRGAARPSAILGLDFENRLALATLCQAMGGDHPEEGS
jgi:hypothetical protein